MAKAQFNLITVLVVIAFLALLAGIAVPLFKSLGTNRMASLAGKRADILTRAIKEYEVKNGKLPWYDGDSDGVKDKTPDDAEWDGGVNENAYYDKMTAALNIRDKDWNPRDPWGKRFVVLMDLDCDGRVNLGSKKLNGTVFVYSVGPDGSDQNCVEGSDDVCTWR